MNDESDRVLLEKAAKAAGYVVSRWADDGQALMLLGEQEPWNPRHDSGQALELAVKLDLYVGKSAVGKQRFASRHDFDMPGNAIYESENGDPLAATRRAIVRAAAAIWDAQCTAASTT